MSQEWISTKKAAELMGVSQRTIQNWVDDGKLVCSKTAGGHRRLNTDEVSKFLKSNQLPNTLNPKPSQLPLDATNNKQMRILIVEDDLTFLRLCELRFSKFSILHDLHLATNAYQALIMIGKYQPHIIFTDLKMPKIDGIKMINEINLHPDLKNTRIVVVTGLETREIIQMGELPPGILVLPKPIPFQTVETILYQQLLAFGIDSNTLEEF